MFGTAERPRMCVYKSSKHIYVQFIDDDKGETLFAVSTKTNELQDSLKGKAGIEKASAVGNLAAQKAKDAGIKTIVFDRGGYRYHGKVKAVAEAARKSGLQF
jgi:large subunit ribosomal protein L18